MPTTRTVTLPGAGAAILTVSAPAFSIDRGTPASVGAGSFDIPALIVSGVAADTLVGEAFDGSAVAAPPGGSEGYAVDTVAGSTFVEPAAFTAVVDAAAGVTTIAANPYLPQAVLLSAPSVTYLAAGGTGTVLAAGAGSLFDFQGSTDSLFAAGGSDTVYLNGGGNSVWLADTGNFVEAISSSITGPTTTNVINVATGNTVAALGGVSVINQDGPGLAILGNGNDYLYASGTGADTILALSGWQTITYYNGGLLAVSFGGDLDMSSSPYGNSTAQAASTVFGGTGSVTITGLTSTAPNSILNDLIVGGTGGHNRITLNSAGGTVFGGGDGDVITSDPSGPPAGSGYSLPRGNLLVAGSGAETIDGLNGVSIDDNTIFGGSGADCLTGGIGDTIVAGAGRQTIVAFGGMTRLGSGDDVALLTGTDTLVGGAGSATVGALGRPDYATEGAGGNPVLVFGGSGVMLFLNESLGADTVRGGAGSMTVQGGAGGGIFYGGSAGGNILFAGTGAATLVGGGGGDQLVASGSAADYLVAGPGNETLNAVGQGNDILQGGSGNDVMEAGFGTEIFAFAKGGGGSTTISGYAQGIDHVALQGYGAGAVTATTTVDGNAVLTLSDNTRITVVGVTALIASDFL